MSSPTAVEGPARSIPAGQALLGLRHAGPRARRWRCSCTRTRSPRVLSTKNRGIDPAQRGDPAGVLVHARPARAARLHGDRGQDQPDRAGRQAQPAAGRARSCSRTMFPSWFAGVAFAAIAIGALVPAAIMSIAAANLFTRNIYREFFKPGRHHRAGGQGLQAGVAGGQARRAGLRPPPRQADAHQLPAARRHLDPADLPGDRVRPLHPLVPPLGAARRLGGRHGLRHRGGVQRRQPGHRASTSAARSRHPVLAARSATSR